MEMTVNSSENSVILILFAFSDNLSAENSKLSAESWHRGHHLLGCIPPPQISLDLGMFVCCREPASQILPHNPPMSPEGDFTGSSVTTE